MKIDITWLWNGSCRIGTELNPHNHDAEPSKSAPRIVNWRPICADVNVVNGAESAGRYHCHTPSPIMRPYPAIASCGISAFRSSVRGVAAPL